MGSKNTRKTFQIGHSTGITLPKGWVDYHGKDKVSELTLLGDAILILAPKGLEGKAKQALEFLDNGH